MKNTYRFFINQPLQPLLEVTDAELVRQWSTVLRLRPGQQLVVLDGSGAQALAEVTTLSKRAAQLRLVQQLEPTGEPQLQLTLCVGLIRADRFEWVLQKGTELGAVAFIPLRCERSLRDSLSTARLARWQRIIREAAEQSGRSRLPSLFDPVTLEQSFALCSQGILLAETGANVGLHSTVAALPLVSGIWSGPEGGWSAEEYAQAAQAGIPSVSLGPRIMRAETAPLAALSALMFARGEWDTPVDAN